MADLTAVPDHWPVCHGFRNCCQCAACRQTEKTIAEHRAAGRHPFDREGKVKPLPGKKIRQPYEPKAA